MSLGLAFWIVLLLALIFGIYTNWRTPAPSWGNVLLFILLLLLGWQVFGAPLHS
jgi:hypothetical protein